MAEETRRTLVGLEKERLKTHKETIYDELHTNVIDPDKAKKNKVWIGFIVELSLE